MNEIDLMFYNHYTIFKNETIIIFQIGYYFELLNRKKKSEFDQDNFPYFNYRVLICNSIILKCRYNLIAMISNKKIIFFKLKLKKLIFFIMFDIHTFILYFCMK